MIESAGAERTAHAWEALVCDGMPDGDAAIADRQKLIGCCLNPKHPRGKHKARVFATLGFTAENADAPRRSGFSVDVASRHGQSCTDQMTQPVASPGVEDALPESSLALLLRAQNGDQAALDVLLARYRPRLRRWAHRRLPSWARDLADTDDVVQDTLIKAIRNLDGFVNETDAGFQNYLRLSVGNAIKDEMRKARRRPSKAALDPSLPSDTPSPLERAVGRRRLARYESALARLAPDEREAVVARLEFGFTHSELAAVLGKRTPDAARKLCKKAIAQLVTLMAAMQPDEI